MTKTWRKRSTTAAAVGLLLSLNASVAGAEGRLPGRGRQRGGNGGGSAGRAQRGHSGPKRSTPSSIALGNLLGLVCDPVGGLVEVPCQNRNAIGVAAAFSSAQLALSGVGSLVPFDEMAIVHA